MSNHSIICDEVLNILDSHLRDDGNDEFVVVENNGIVVENNGNIVEIVGNDENMRNVVGNDVISENETENKIDSIPFDQYLTNIDVFAKKITDYTTRTRADFEQLNNENKTLKRQREEDSSLLINTQQQCAQVVSQLEQEQHKCEEYKQLYEKERKNRKSYQKKFKALNNEYILRIPKFDHVYSEHFQHMISLLTPPELEFVMKDGRSASWVITPWIKKKWAVGNSENLQVKMFTDHGCVVSPSKNIGIGRTNNDDDTKEKIENTDIWVFVDIRSYPDIKYVFKHNDAVMKLWKQKAQFINFQKIVDAK